MNRGYNRREYLNLIKKIREKISGVKISSDIIVGFPGEGQKQFESTVGLVKKVKFYKAYISQYSPRTETSAFKFKDDVPRREKKQRQKILNELIIYNPLQKAVALKMADCKLAVLTSERKRRVGRNKFSSKI
jgi:tRNA-2-methylthio-N6-dimethylallyladenosine synthase